MPREDWAEVAVPFEVDKALLAAEAVCKQRLHKVQRGRIYRRRAGLEADGLIAVKEDRAQYILDQLRHARWVVANEMIPLRESKEAVAFFSVLFSVVGFLAGAVATSNFARNLVASVFG